MFAKKEEELEERNETDFNLDENFDPSVFYEKIAGGDLVNGYISDKSEDSEINTELNAR